MLSTCRRNPGNDDYNRCIETFPYLFDRCLEHGHVPDLEFESLGFKQDINIQGNYVRRESTITQESRQRAKCLTHEYQAEQRMERKIQLEAEVSRKKVEAANKLVQKIGKNDNCVMKICKILGRDQSEEHLEDASMEDFSKLLNADLESFILVRNKDNQVKSKLPKKGKLEDAMTGENNLIKLAFDSRLMENFIKKTFAVL